MIYVYGYIIYRLFCLYLVTGLYIMVPAVGQQCKNIMPCLLVDGGQSNGYFLVSVIFVVIQVAMIVVKNDCYFYPGLLCKRSGYH
jgi:hypothetical protein